MDPDFVKPRVTVSMIPTAEAELRKALTVMQFEELEWHLSNFPTDGDVMPGCGGFRKLRWSAQGRGKRGGVRVIHYYVIGNIVMVAKAYAKNDKSDVTSAEKEELRDFAKYLQETYSPKNNER